MQLQLTTEERLRLENLKIKNDNLQLLSQMIKAEYDGALENFCRKNSKKIIEIENVDLNSGLVSFKEPVGKKLKG